MLRGNILNNLHIVMNEFRHPSRILKQVGSISSLTDINHVYVASLCGNGQKTDEQINEQASLKRFRLRTRWLPKGLLVQVVKYIEFTCRIFLFYRDKNIGLVNIHHFSLLPLGFLMKLSYGAKLIYDTHELETETNGLSGTKKLFSKIVESVLIKKADHIFVVSENIADWYEEKYGIKRPTVVLNAPSLFPFQESNVFRDIFNLRADQKIFLYQGMLASGRGIELLLDCFAERKDDAVVIIFLGYGPLEKEINNAASLSGNIFFHAAVSPKILLKYTSSADIGVALIPKVSLSDYYCMPNKLFEYCMAGLPVLASNLKEMSEFVERYQIGFVSKNLSSLSINKIVDEIAMTDITKFKKNARRAAEENSWEIQEKKMLAHYYNLFDSK